MPVETVSAEEVNVSMSEVAAEEAEEDVQKLADDINDYSMEEAAMHMKTELKYQMSPLL